MLPLIAAVTDENRARLLALEVKICEQHLDGKGELEKHNSAATTTNSRIKNETQMKVFNVVQEPLPLSFHSLDGGL